MIHEIRVYDSKGELKKTHSAKEATDMFWDSSEPSTMNKRFCVKGAGKVRPVVIKTINCKFCKKDFSGEGKKVFCSRDCQQKNWREVARHRLQEKTLRINSNARIVDGDVVYKIMCRECDTVVDMNSVTAKFCSSTCRDRSHRTNYAPIKKKMDADKARRRREIATEIYGDCHTSESAEAG